MKLVTLQPVEGSQKSVEIKVGRTIIGRGPLLECADKKVSRNHAIIEVRESGDIYLTPTHVNPCFYLPNDSNTGFEVLKKDCPQLIHNGDSFSLLPNSFRYRVSISDVSNYESIESEKNTAAPATAVAAVASTTAANKVKESSSATSCNTAGGTGNKKDETLLNGDNRKDLKEDSNHKASTVEESPKDNGRPAQPIKNGLSPVRASSRRNDPKTNVDKDLVGHRDPQNKSQASNKQNSSEPDLVKDPVPSASVKEKESKGRESRKAPVTDDSKSDKKSLVKETSNSNVSLAYNSKDKSPLASKKILSEKSAAKKDTRKEKTDSEKQKQLKNFDFDDEDDEPVVKPTGKKPAQKATAKKPAEKPAAESPSVSLKPSTSKKKETPNRKRSPLPSQTSSASASGSRSTRTHRTLIQRISLDDFMASDEEWIATYASSDEERKKARKRLSKRKSAAEASSDEDDWSGKKAKKRPAKKSRKSNTDDDNENSEDVDAEEEEVKPKRSRGRAATAPRRSKKKAKTADASESSEESKNDAESGDEDDDDNEGDKLKAPVKKAPAPKKKESSKTPAAATPTPPKKKVFRRKKSLLYAESEEDFQRQLARAIRESKKEQLKKECEKREKAAGYRPTDHSALSSTTAST